jgi:hypothetical protein
MRYSIILISLILLSCNESDEKTDLKNDEVFTLCEEPTLDPDTTSFTYFVGRFPEMIGTYHLKHNDLWEGVPFFDEAQQEYNYEQSYISYYLADKWLMKDSLTSELGDELIDSRRGLRLGDDRWYMLHYGIRISTEHNHYLLIHWYEKTSEINGAYWTSFWLDFSREGELNECLKLGREGIYTSTNSFENDAGFSWTRYTTFESMDLIIKSEDDINVCIQSRLEIEGDLDEEEKAAVNGTTVINDSLHGYVEYYKDKCVEY